MVGTPDEGAAHHLGGEQQLERDPGQHRADQLGRDVGQRRLQGDPPDREQGNGDGRIDVSARDVHRGGDHDRERDGMHQRDTQQPIAGAGEDAGDDDAGAGEDESEGADRFRQGSAKKGFHRDVLEGEGIRRR